MKDNAFIHLHAHSNFSSDGLETVERLIERANSLNMKAIALTDENTVAGMIRFSKKAAQLGIKPIIGCDISVLPFKNKSFSSRTYPCLFIAENETGFSNIVKLINIANNNKAVSLGSPFIIYDDLKQYSDGIIALLGGNKGELTELLRAKKTDDIDEYVKLVKSLFPEENIFLELVSPAFADYIKINRYYEKLGAMLNIKTVVTNNVLFLNKEDLLPAIFLSDDDLDPDMRVDEFIDSIDFPQYLASSQDIAGAFKDHPEAIENTELIADRCKFMFKMEKQPFPSHDFVRGQDADSFLWNLFVERLEIIYGNVSNPVLNKRLNKELEYIKNAKLSNYMVLLVKITDFLKKRNISTGIGRGILFPSLVSYLAGITNIDPVERQPMNFQEFSEPVKYPEIALEVPASQFKDVVDFIKSLYQEKYMCFAGNYVSPSRQSLLADILEKLHVQELSRTSYYTEEVLNTQIIDNADIKDHLGELYREAKIKHPKVAGFILAKLLNTSKILDPDDKKIAITSRSYDAITPMEKISDDSFDGIVSQLDCKSLIDSGVALITIHTEKLLDVINQTLKSASADPHEILDINRIPFNDKITFELLSQGETTGIPPFDSISFKTLLRQEKPRNIDQLRKVVVKSKANTTSKPNLYNETEFLRSVVETDIGYKCAYLKAHFPTSYLTALISVYAKSRDVFVYIREARKIGINVKSPDILTSDYEFKQDQKGIQMGLSIIPGFEKTAFEELKRIRKGFPYNNLADLISNADRSKLQMPLIRKLIQCGAFDSLLNITRGEMLAEFNRICETLVDENQQSTRYQPIQSPYEPPTQFLSDNEDDPELLVNWELNSVRFPITVDQIEINRKFLDRIYASSPDKLSVRFNNAYKTFVGYIDSFDNEGPFIDVKTECVLDFEGFMVTVSNNVMKQNLYAIQTTLPVVILGKVVFENDDVVIKAFSINTLTVVKYSAENTTQLMIDLEGENEQTLKLIYKVLKRFKGDTPVEPYNFSNPKKRIFRKICEMKTLICPLLLHCIWEILPPEKAVIK